MISQYVHVFQLIAAVLGLIIVVITYRAARISSQSYLYYLSAGFGIIALGSLVEELLANLVVNFTIRQDHLVESIFVNIGFIIIWFALREVKSSDEQHEVSVIDLKEEEEDVE